MTRTNFSTSGKIGTLLDGALGADQFTVGDCVAGSNNTEWVYASINTAVVEGDLVGVSEAFSAAPLTTALAQAGHTIGVAGAAASAGKFLFVATKGKVSVRAAALASLDKKVFLSDVNGVATSSSTSAISIEGMVLASAGGATTALRGAILNWPHHVIASV